MCNYLDILQAQDLALLMRNMEHWAHRLFPKMPFDEVLERVERLGAKREVQVRPNQVTSLFSQNDIMM